MLLNRQMGRRRFLALTAGAAALIGLGSSACVNAATLALRNARLFSGTGLPPQKDMTVAMAGPAIIAVGRDADIVLNRATKIIDCAGAFVMPGIIDTHVHLTVPLLQRVLFLPDWLRAGITTVRDTGTVAQGPAILRDLVSQLGPAPRVIATGGILGVKGGYPAALGPVGVAAAVEVEGVQGAIDGVNMTLDAGAEFIKVYIETGYRREPPEDTGLPTLSLDQVTAIVQTAHGRGVPVTAHVTSEWEVRRAIEGGVDSLAHTPLDPLPLDLLTAMVDRKIAMTSTLHVWEHGDYGRATATAQRNVAMLVKAGGVVAMGTDFPFVYTAALPIDELKLMRGAGLTNTQVLLACTRDAALACARPDLGTIEPGKVADIIIVDGDPLINLTALERATLVIHDGVVVR